MIKSKWPIVLVYQGLNKFLGCRTFNIETGIVPGHSNFSAKIRKFLGKQAVVGH